MRVSCNCRMVVIFGFGPGGPGDQGEIAPCECPNCHNKVFLYHVRSKKSARQLDIPAGLPEPPAYSAELQPPGRQGSRAPVRDADGRAGSAVAERLDEIPAAAGTALTGRALTSFDPDGFRDPPVCPAGRLRRGGARLAAVAGRWAVVAAAGGS